MLLSFVDSYKRFRPTEFGEPGLVGFGYSFSNVGRHGSGIKQMPFFAIGAVNDDTNNHNGTLDKIVVFDFFCIGLKCKSEVESPKTIQKNLTSG